MKNSDDLQLVGRMVLCAIDKMEGLFKATLNMGISAPWNLKDH